ncbi:MAG: glycogen synthase GlgA [Candidatus Margulisbacteria bacterium]|nr:glycogen synthase GlgA [Candidatus Margulisiibacteriota bacterium]
MRIFYVSPEVVPFAKTGGLADVAGSLPKTLAELGHDVRIIMPRYKMIDPKKWQLKKLNDEIWQGVLPGSKVMVYFYENEAYFASRDGLYQLPGGIDYDDNLQRFSAFCQAGLRLLKAINWQPEIVHCNDWQSALAIAYLKATYADDPFYKKMLTVYSIHNMAYLGLFNKELLPLTGLGWDQFTPDRLEFWGNFSLAKAGIVYSDVINTVSEKYAQEIQTAEFGCGLDGLLRSRAKDVYGIVNGLDYDVWNPATDKNIPRRYSPATLDLKVFNKLELQKRNSLPQKKETPVIGITTRLADQKGLDILSESLHAIMGLQCQLIVLGTGDQKYHDLLKEEKKRFPDQLGLNLGFDAALAELIYAGADMFLMPSHYEPCGLGQLISFKYGTIPIVRKTGGLADTVQNFNSKTGDGTGFVFEEYHSEALIRTIKNACDTFHKKNLWKALQEKVMRLDYSWEASAKKYVELYAKATGKF